jgi:hypothetical protein
MSTLIGTDLLAVERSNTVYKETFSNRANIDSTDLLLVERGSTTYKCTYSDWTATPTSASATHGWGSANTAYDITVRNQAGGADQTNSFSYFNQSMTTTGGAVTGRLYIGLRMRGATSYYHDFCLSHVQVLQSGGSSYRTDSTFTNGYDWNFHNTSSSNGIGSWLTCTAMLSNQTYTADPSTLSYGSITGTGTTNGKWNRATGTNSSWTGAADGTYTPMYSGGGGTKITGSRPQASNTYYIYTETSGSGYTIGTTTLWLKSPEMTLYNGDILRMLYHADGGTSYNDGLGYHGGSTTTGTASDVLFFRFK